MLSNEVARNERGADVCRRIVKVATEKVKGDASKGFEYVDAYCNKPVVLNITEGRKMCPQCDKQPPVGNVHPRTTNSAGIALTPAELKECGVSEDPSLKQKDMEVSKPVEGTKATTAVEATVIVKKDEVVLSIPLKDLEANQDIAAFLIKKVIDGFGSLPTPTYSESKRVMKLEEKLEALLRG